MFRIDKIGMAVFLFLMFFTSACQTVNIGKMNESIIQAESHLNVIKGFDYLEPNKLYPDDFNQAEKKYGDALENSKKGKRDQAYADALQSIEASNQMLKKIAVGPLRQKAIEVKSEIESKGPDSSLRDLLPKLNKILEYTKQIEDGQQQFMLGSLINTRDGLDGIRTAVKNRKELKIGSDISFKIGKYKVADLSGEAKKILEKLVEDIVSARNNYTKQYSKMIVNIKAMAYTDETPFSDGSKLLKELAESVNCPRSQPERRKCFNNRLSELRAETIANYMEQRVLGYKSKEINIQIQKKFVGKGENIPPDAAPPYPTDDQRRRICNVESYCSFE